MKKTCTKCKLTKPLTDFSRLAKSKDGHHSWCSPCFAQKNREWRVANKYLPKHGHRAACQRCSKETYHHPFNGCSRCRALKERYGITPEIRLQMEQEQQGLCKLCGHLPDKRGLFIDHCHTTGLVRGLLCQKCNFGLGLLGDQVDLLQKAIRYLQANSQTKMMP